MKKSTLISLLLALLLLGGIAAWRFMPRELSYDECSPVYRHFADMQLDDVRITYFKDKIINDTLRLPVTLIEAESEHGWNQLDSIFGYTRTIDSIVNLPELPDSVKREFREYFTSFYTYRAHRETPETMCRSEAVCEGDICVLIFLNMHCVTIYEPVDIMEERDAINQWSLMTQEKLTRKKH